MPNDNKKYKYKNIYIFLFKQLVKDVITIFYLKRICV